MDPIIASSLIGAGTSLAGGLLGGGSSDSGSDAMAAAIMEGINFQKEQYTQGREDLAPFRGLAENALPYLTEAAGAESPLYQMRLKDSQDAIEAMMAKQGRFGSGAAVAATAENARRVSAEEAEARWGRNLSLADMASGAAKYTVGAGQQAASGIADSYNKLGQTYYQQGQNKAGAYGGIAGGLNQAVQGGMENYFFRQYLDQYSPTGGSGGGSANPNYSYGGSQPSLDVTNPLDKYVT